MYLENQVEVHELAEEGYEGYEQMVIKAVENGKKEFDSGNFFIDVIWRKKKSERGGIRKDALWLKNIPTPHFNQTVYLYHRDIDDVEVLWSLPDQDTCTAYYHNRNHVPPSDYPILTQVMNYFDGTIFRLVDTFEQKR